MLLYAISPATTISQLSFLFNWIADNAVNSVFLKLICIFFNTLSYRVKPLQRWLKNWLNLHYNPVPSDSINKRKLSKFAADNNYGS